MKKRLSLLLIIICSALVFAQQKYYAGVDMTVQKSFKKYSNEKELLYTIKEGTTYHIDSIWQTVEPSENKKDAKLSFYLDIPDLAIEVDNDLLKHVKFVPTDIYTYWNALIIERVLPQLSKRGVQYEMRVEMENDSFDFINKVKSNGIELRDPYLENYIYGLIAKIAPISLVDGRPCNVNLLIEQNPLPAYTIYPNGTIVLSTGLIGSLHSEDELVAILANGIAHFVLDQCVQNATDSITRQKRAEFWSEIATIATAVSETTLSATTGYYIPGIATMAMALTTERISNRVIDRLGMNYTNEQCLEADMITLDVLKMLGYDQTALCSAFKRITIRLSEERNFLYMTNPLKQVSLTDRINNLGNTGLIKAQRKYEQIISFAITSLVNMHFNQRRFRQAISLADININNNVASADDYLQKANSLLNLRNDHNTNVVASELIETAKTINPQNVNIYRLSVLIALREDNYDKALSMLNQYIAVLSDSSDNPTEGQFNYRNSERYWASLMLAKIKEMKNSGK